MRALGAARWWALSSTSITALAALFAPERAYASCTYHSTTAPFTNVIALAGDVCAAVFASTGYASGATLPGVTLPPGVTYTGFAFFAYGGGVINSPSVGITTPALTDAYGAWSDGSSSAINFLGAVTDVQTSGASAHALYASNGGAISLGGGKIESTGDGAFGLYTSGVDSTITVNGAPTIQTYGVGAHGVVADNGGAVV